MTIRPAFRFAIFLGWVLISVIQVAGQPTMLFLQETSTNTPTSEISGTDTNTPSVTPSIIGTFTNTPTTTNTLTATYTQALLSPTSTIQSSPTHTPIVQWTATPIVFATETPVSPIQTFVPPGITATLEPFPSITYVFASTQESQTLLIVEREPVSPTRVQVYVSYLWRRVLAFWPLVILTVLWIAIAAWFVLVQRRSE